MQSIALLHQQLHLPRNRQAWKPHHAPRPKSKYLQKYVIFSSVPMRHLLWLIFLAAIQSYGSIGNVSSSAQNHAIEFYLAGVFPPLSYRLLKVFWFQFLQMALPVMIVRVSKSEMDQLSYSNTIIVSNGSWSVRIRSNRQTFDNILSHGIESGGRLWRNCANDGSFGRILTVTKGLELRVSVDEPQKDGYIDENTIKHDKKSRYHCTRHHIQLSTTTIDISNIESHSKPLR